MSLRNQCGTSCHWLFKIQAFWNLLLCLDEYFPVFEEMLFFHPQGQAVQGDPQDRGTMVLQNMESLWPNSTGSHPRRPEFVLTSIWEPQILQFFQVCHPIWLWTATLQWPLQWETWLYCTRDSGWCNTLLLLAWLQYHYYSGNSAS